MKANKTARIAAAITQASVEAGIGGKTIKAIASKGAKVAKEESAVSRWFDGKQGYRLFKSADDTAYHAQGTKHNVTIAALRSVRYSIADTAETGNTIALFKGAQGFGAIVGKAITIDGEAGTQAGKFVLSHKSKGFIRAFAGMTELINYIRKEGQKGDAYHKALAGKFVLAGDRYSIVTNGKAIRRWIAGTNNGRDTQFSAENIRF